MPNLPAMREPPWRVALLEDDADTRVFFEGCVHAHPSLVLASSFGLLREARSWFASNAADLLLTGTWRCRTGTRSR